MSARPGKTKSKAGQTSKPKEDQSQKPQSKSKSSTFFPFARYTSIVGVHTSLLAFTALFLPRTTLSSIIHSPIISSDSQHASLRSITGSPLKTVAWMCAGAFILQAWWASWIRGWSLEDREDRKDSSEDSTKRKLRRQEWNSGRISAFHNACISTFAASLGLSVVCVLFGAPINSHPLHTYVLSLLVSLLTVFTPAYTLGIPSLKEDNKSFVLRQKWIRLFAEISPRIPIERALVYPVVGTFLGSWLGAIPIGLDWERPWQKWPLPPAFGAVSGYIVGSLAALAVSAVQTLAEVDRKSSQNLSPSVKKPKSS